MLVSPPCLLLLVSLHPLARTPPALAPSAAYRIVPGRSLGHLRLGVGTATLHWLGPLCCGTAAMRQTWSTWCNQRRPPVQLTVYAALPATRTATIPVVRAIRTTSPAFRLPGNLRVGTPLRQQYGRLVAAATYHLPSGAQRVLLTPPGRGIAFELESQTAQSPCRAIVVMAAGSSQAAQLRALASYLPQTTACGERQAEGTLRR